MSNLAFIAVMGVLAVLGLLGFGLVAGEREQLTVGEPVPALELPLLEGEGTTSLSDYQGSWVLVNFWASWCGPCRTESPAIEAYSERMADEGLVVVGINTEDLTEDARGFVDEYELSWEMLRDRDGSAKDPFGVFGLPETFLVDPQGRLAWLQRGPIDRQALDDEVTPFLELPAKGTARS